MTKVQTDRLILDRDKDGFETKAVLARVSEASAESVERVLSASHDDPDGRSQWLWFRLNNGDLIFGVFPQGDTYFDTARDHSR